jgi:hypothetical protein
MVAGIGAWEQKSVSAPFHPSGTWAERPLDSLHGLFGGKNLL